MTRGEAARLKNENLNLRKEAGGALRAGANAAAARTDKATRGARGEKTEHQPSARSASRSHVVQPGDTLFSLSRLYYNSPDRWKDILDANEKSIDDPGKLKLGQTLMIP